MLLLTNRKRYIAAVVVSVLIVAIGRCIPTRAAENSQHTTFGPCGALAEGEVWTVRLRRAGYRLQADGSYSFSDKGLNFLLIPCLGGESLTQFAVTVGSKGTSSQAQLDRLMPE